MGQYHIYGIGNALVDIEYEVKLETLNELGVDKGLMTLIELDRHHELYAQLSTHQGRRCSGGSAANTIIGAAQLGANNFYSCKVANDESGSFYMKDLQANSVASNLNIDNRPDGVTGKCLVMITPDADRTMNTYLGITSEFGEAELDLDAVTQSDYIYIEGYLAPAPDAQSAAIKARKTAKSAGVKTALTLSDPNMVSHFKDGLLAMAGDDLDLCFCNDAEAKLMFDTDNLNDCVEGMKSLATQFAITLGADGALLYDGDEVINIPAKKVNAIDTNGAGDIYAGSFLYGVTQGMNFTQCGELASAAAAKLVTQYGARLSLDEMQEARSLTGL